MTELSFTVEIGLSIVYEQGQYICSSLIEFDLTHVLHEVNHFFMLKLGNIKVVFVDVKRLKSALP